MSEVSLKFGQRLKNKIILREESGYSIFWVFRESHLHFYINSLVEIFYSTVHSKLNKTCTFEVRTRAKAYDRQIRGHFRKVSKGIYYVLVIQCSTNIHFVVNVLDPNS